MPGTDNARVGRRAVAVARGGRRSEGNRRGAAHIGPRALVPGIGMQDEAPDCNPCRPAWVLRIGMPPALGNHVIEPPMKRARRFPFPSVFGWAASPERPSMTESFPAIGPARPSTRAQSLVALALALAVFLIDALTPLDIAIAVLYVVVVLLVALGESRRRTLAAGVAGVVVTLVGFALSLDFNDSAGSLARCVFSLLAITITSLLAMRNLASTARLREQIQMLNLTHDAIVVYDMKDCVTFWN